MQQCHGFPGGLFPLPSEEEKEGDRLPDPAGSEEEEEEEDPILAWRASGAAVIGLGRGRGEIESVIPHRSFVRVTVREWICARESWCSIMSVCAAESAAA